MENDLLEETVVVRFEDFELFSELSHLFISKQYLTE